MSGEEERKEPAELTTVALVPAEARKEREAADQRPSTLVRPGPLRRGATVGRYLIVSLLGRGGMGAVYAAYDPELDRRVAVKVLHTAQGYDDARKVLVREARMLGQLSHPNVVQVHDVGEHAGDVFVAMELIDGEPLDAWCRREPKPAWQAIVAAYLDAARGLAAAHAKGVIHRDVKPANILRGKDGRVLVVDFGLAVGASQASAENQDLAGAEARSPSATTSVSSSDRLTEAGAVIGTPKYMAPEQLGPGGASPASDQYAFCVSLHESLYGEPPFKMDKSLPRPEATRDLFERKSAGRLAPPPVGSPVPRWIFDVLAKGLAPSPEARHSSMTALALALSDDPAVRRRSLARTVGIVAAAAALSVAGAVGWVKLAPRDPCKDVGLELAGVWDDAVRSRVQSSFARTGRPDAASTAGRVLALLDAQASAWTKMRGAVCAAGRARTEAREILDLREACLARRRGELEALAATLAEPGDPRVLDRAVAAAAGLYPVAYCADTAALTARVRPPEDPTVRRRVAELQPRVDRLATACVTGQYQSGLASSAALLRDTADVPYAPLRAQALFWTGRLKEGAGDFDGAKESLHEAALAAADGGDDVLVAEATCRLLLVVGDRQERHEDAALIRWMGATAVERAHDDRVRGTWLNAEGASLMRAGKLAEAKVTLERAIALREKTLGADHLDVGVSSNNLGLVLERMGAYRESIAAIERGLAVRERVLGDGHPDVAQSLTNLGLVLESAGDYARAVAVQERALAIRERALGDAHPDVAQTLNNLALALLRSGDVPRALATSERAVALFERAFGTDHGQTQAAMDTLASVVLATGDAAKAIAIHERNLASVERIRAAEHPELVVLLANYGNALHEAGEDARAKAALERAASLAPRYFDADHPYRSLVSASLGRVLVGLGRLDDAEPLLTRARDAYEKALGPTSPRLALPLLGLGELAIARHHPAEAVAPLDRALGLVDGEYRSAVLFTLAEALIASPAGAGRARALVEEAHAAYERAGHQRGIARTARWLAQHR